MTHTALHTQPVAGAMIRAVDLHEAKPVLFESP
jgi:hypothetical protein